MSGDPYREDAHEDRSLLIVADAGVVIAFNRDTGAVAWRHEAMSSLNVAGMQLHVGGPIDFAIHQGRVFVALRDRIMCLDYKTGALIGNVPIPTTARRPTILIDGPHLYFVAVDRVLCFNHDGQMLWQTPHGIPETNDGAAIGVPGNVRPGDEAG